MPKWLGIAGRVILALVGAIVLLASTTLAAFFALGHLFGYSGHPAGPDLPAGCYIAYLVGAPILALGATVWLVFRWPRRPSGS